MALVAETAVWLVPSLTALKGSHIFYSVLHCPHLNYDGREYPLVGEPKTRILQNDKTTLNFRILVA